MINKMLAGELYDANYDKDLFIEICKCKDLCKKISHFNLCDNIN